MSRVLRSGFEVLGSRILRSGFEVEGVEFCFGVQGLGLRNWGEGLDFEVWEVGVEELRLRFLGLVFRFWG